MDLACTLTTLYRVDAAHSIADDARKTDVILVVVASGSATHFCVILSSSLLDVTVSCEPNEHI